MSLSNVLGEGAKQLQLPAARRLAAADMQELAESAREMLFRVRDSVFAGEEGAEQRKVAPEVSHTNLAKLLGLSKDAFDYRLRNKTLPDSELGPGRPEGKGRARVFTMTEVRQWVKHIRGPVRPEGQDALTIVFGNFKGGVSKTTCSVTVAQGLARHGYDVLLIDLDPQASATALMGIRPERDVQVQDTLYEMFFGDAEKADASYAVIETYFPGVDFIPSTLAMFGCEFSLTARLRRQDFSAWSLLDHGLRKLRKRYDVIIIDTAPALSLMNFNALFAADGIVVPVPPSALDYASSVSFWRLFDEMLATLTEYSPAMGEKQWDFAYVLASLTDKKGVTAFVKKWLATTYAERILPVEIPSSVVLETTSAYFSTVYDIERYEGSRGAFARARESFDLLVELLDVTCQRVWAGRVAAGKEKGAAGAESVREAA
jgi:chromosome partitioning protein